MNIYCFNILCKRFEGSTRGVIVNPFAQVVTKQQTCNVSITIFILNLKWIEMTFQFPSSKSKAGWEFFFSARPPSRECPKTTKRFKKTLPGSCISTSRCLPCMHEDYQLTGTGANSVSTRVWGFIFIFIDPLLIFWGTGFTRDRSEKLNFPTN